MSNRPSEIAIGGGGLQSAGELENGKLKSAITEESSAQIDRSGVVC
jgi:hypothetical protein